MPATSLGNLVPIEHAAIDAINGPGHDGGENARATPPALLHEAVWDYSMSLPQLSEAAL